MAVDVECGSGQNTIGLAKRFKHVIALDVSEVQIKYAKEKTGISPMLSFGLDLGRISQCLMIAQWIYITFASSFHWFDTDKVCEVVFKACIKTRRGSLL